MKSADGSARRPNRKLRGAIGAIKYGLLTLIAVLVLDRCGTLAGAMIGAYGGRYWMLLANDAVDIEGDTSQSRTQDNS